MATDRLDESSPSLGEANLTWTSSIDAKEGFTLCFGLIGIVLVRLLCGKDPNTIPSCCSLEEFTARSISWWCCCCCFAWRPMLPAALVGDNKEGGWWSRTVLLSSSLGIGSNDATK